MKNINKLIKYLLATPSIRISACTPTEANSMPFPETGILGCMFPGLTLQLNGEPGTGCPLNLHMKNKY